MGDRQKKAADLDAKLAEKLGWEVDLDSSGGVCRTPKPGPWTPLSDLSTTWDGAGLVVEAMRERGYRLTLSITFVATATFTKRLGVTRDASTAPEAILKAALAALEAEEAI